MKKHGGLSFSFRTWMIVFVLVFPVVGAFSSWLSYRAGYQAVQEMILSMQEEVKERIHRKVENLLQAQHRINQVNEDEHRLGNLDISDFGQLRRRFMVQIKNQPMTAYVYHSDAAGRFCGVMRGPDGNFLYTVNNNPSPSEYDIFELTPEAEVGSLKKHVPALDFRKRTWYRSPVEANAEVWGGIFSQHDILRINIPLSRPIYDAAGRFQGVFGINMDVTPLSGFLTEVAKVSRCEAFLLEGNGLVVATSYGSPFRMGPDQKPVRYKGIDSDHQALRAACRKLKPGDEFKDFSKGRQIMVSVGGRNYYVSVDPFVEGRGIKWYLLVISPEETFIGSVQKSAQTGIYLLIFTIGLIGCLGFVFVRSMVNPLFRLVRQTSELAAGSVTSLGIDSRIREIDILCKSFEESARQVVSRENKLVEREAFLNALLETIPIPVYYKDLNGRYLGFNKVYETFFGETRENMVGKTAFDVHPRELADIYHANDNELLDKKGIMVFETRVRNVHGEIRDVIFNKALLTDSQGTVSGIIGTINDITERKLAEQEKKRLEEQYHQAQKLESIGRLAGGVAHDLNNLLSPIIGYSEILLEDLEADHAQRESVEEIVEAGIRARELVHQLLAFSRKQALEFRHIDLNDLLRNFERLLRRTIREDIAMHLHLSNSLPAIKGDPGQLEQVVMNLAVNAQDAMPEGGELTIETDLTHLDESYAEDHEGVSPGMHTMLAISDTGFGMDEETRKHLFEPFYTTKDKDKGTGLGMATVYGIVKQHKGSIWFYSEPGLGSTFKIYLPVSAESAREKDKIYEAPPDLRGTETILLVEDHDHVRKLAHAVLKRNGYKVLVAGGGKEALDISSRYTGSIHMLLTDVVMPKMNGKELYERVARQFPGIKCLYMSGYTDNVIAHHGIINAGTHYIPKPFSIKVLATKVREVLDEND